MPGPAAATRRAGSASGAAPVPGAGFALSAAPDRLALRRPPRPAPSRPARRLRAGADGLHRLAPSPPSLPSAPRSSNAAARASAARPPGRSAPCRPASLRNACGADSAAIPRRNLAPKARASCGVPGAIHRFRPARSRGDAAPGLPHAPRRAHGRFIPRPVSGAGPVPGVPIAAGPNPVATRCALRCGSGPAGSARPSRAVLPCRFCRQGEFRTRPACSWRGGAPARACFPPPAHAPDAPPRSIPVARRHRRRRRSRCQEFHFRQLLLGAGEPDGPLEKALFRHTAHADLPGYGRSFLSEVQLAAACQVLSQPSPPPRPGGLWNRVSVETCHLSLLSPPPAAGTTRRRRGALLIRKAGPTADCAPGSAGRAGRQSRPIRFRGSLAPDRAGFPSSPLLPLQRRHWTRPIPAAGSAFAGGRGLAAAPGGRRNRRGRRRTGCPRVGGVSGRPRKTRFVPALQLAKRQGPEACASGPGRVGLAGTWARSCSGR